MKTRKCKIKLKDGSYKEVDVKFKDESDGFDDEPDRVDIVDCVYKVPTYGNSHSRPYGKVVLRVNDKLVYRQFDLAKENNYFIDGRRFKLVELPESSVWHLKLKIVEKIKRS